MKLESLSEGVLTSVSLYHHKEFLQLLMTNISYKIRDCTERDRIVPILRREECYRIRRLAEKTSCTLDSSSLPFPRKGREQ